MLGPGPAHSRLQLEKRPIFNAFVSDPRRYLLDRLHWSWLPRHVMYRWDPLGCYHPTFVERWFVGLCLRALRLCGACNETLVPRCLKTS